MRVFIPRHPWISHVGLYAFSSTFEGSVWFQQLKARLADEEAQTKVDSGGKRPASSVVVWCAG